LLVFYRDVPGPDALAALSDVRLACLWLDRTDRPEATGPLTGDQRADLLVVGGGFTGLWTALLAKRADPARDVLVLEGGRVADGATGRNGGFVAASLTHGLLNGLSRWPGDMPTLQRLGRENLAGIVDTIAEYGIECDLVRSGEIDIAVEPYQLDGLAEYAQRAGELGETVHLLDAEQARARVNAPAVLGASYDPDGVVTVDPARLAEGLRRACLAEGVRLHERTPVRELIDVDTHVEARCDGGTVRADRVALATNAYPPLLARIRHFVVPVYDYVLATEPLSDAQWSAIGWSGREGVGDTANQFHYTRTTADGRIVWGGYDAVHYRDGFSPRHDDRDETYGRLAEHFFQLFPQLAGLRFSHAWGGAIDTCSRFTAFWGTAMGGKTGYVAGFTGLGVGASRFGAATMLDLIDGRTTERTELEMVRTKPIPFPPEPLRSLGISWTTAAIRSADAHEGRRNLWLRTLDKVGLGFDS